ncbi:MAG: RNA polymerase sigma factor RpoD/SigA [Lentisphaeria bacterium]|nr:RNA polymerase sigma factor RpoD/SigA [Lentisphaeria bacterium]
MGEIEGYPLISQEDEARLAGFIHDSNSERKDKAYETLVVSNLRLVVKIAHDFKGMGLNLPDLISEGNIGLMRAAEKFNPAKGAKFSSYAAWWIKQSILRAIMNQTRTIRIPAQSGHKMMQIRKMRDSLRLRLGREPLDSEIAAELHFSERTVSTLRLAETSIFSLNDPIQTGENDTFEELISDPNAKSPERLAGDQDSFHRLREALEKLDPREREIIELRFFRKQTLESVSLLIGRTRERVRQIQNQALGKLQTMLKDEADAANF